MHCTLSFSSFLCFMFLLCSLFLFSLSFSLLLMAPKNLVPSKNLIRHRGSSSSSSSSAPFPLNSVRFCDEKTWDDFFKNFSNWAIHSKCLVILSDFPDTPLPGVFSSGDRLLYVRNPRGVLTCSYKSFTSTCMPSIPLYLGLLRYFEEHVS